MGEFLIIYFYRKGKWGSERWTDLPRLAKLATGTARPGTLSLQWQTHTRTHQKPCFKPWWRGGEAETQGCEVLPTYSKHVQKERKPHAFKEACFQPFRIILFQHSLSSSLCLNIIFHWDLPDLLFEITTSSALPSRSVRHHWTHSLLIWWVFIVCSPTLGCQHHGNRDFVGLVLSCIPSA